RPKLRRPWLYPESVFSRRRTGQPVYEWGERIYRRRGQGRNARKSRPAPRVRNRVRYAPSIGARGKLRLSPSCQFAGYCRVHAFLHRGQYRLIAVSAQYVHQLDAIGSEALPAIGFRDLPRVGLVEAHARQYGAAGIFNARGVAHPVGVWPNLWARDRKQRQRKLLVFASGGEIAQFEEPKR